MQKCRVLTKIPCRWSFNPSYMHTFAVTENYFVLIEQSLCISLARVLQLTITHGPMTDAFAWYGNEPVCTPRIESSFLAYINVYTQVRFRLINRHTMAEHDEYIYLAPVFFFLHTINAYEDNNNIVIDICCYENADMLQCMTIEELEVRIQQISFNLYIIEVYFVERSTESRLC